MGLKVFQAAITLTVILSFSQATAQQTIFIRVIDNLSQKPIEKVKASYNKQKATSNDRGYLELLATEGDTVHLSHSHYKDKTVVIPRTANVKVPMEVLDKKIAYTPSFDLFFGHFIGQIRYPRDQRENKKEAYILVLFEIDSVGKSKLIEVLGDPENGFSEQFPKLFESAPGNWDPSYAGRKMALPVVFHLGQGNEMIAPLLDGVKFDRLLNTVVVTGYTPK